MSERVKAIWIGTFILVAIMILAWLLMLLRPTVGDGGRTLRVRFTNIERVSVGTRVTFAGKPVGEVVKIEEIFEARNQPTDQFESPYIYELILKIDSSVKVYSYDEILFSSSGLMGDRSIAIIPKSAPKGSMPAHEMTDDILYAESTDRLDAAIIQLTQVAKTFDRTLSDVNQLIKENREELRETVLSLHHTSEQIGKAFSKTNASDLITILADAFKAFNQVLKQMIEKELVTHLTSATKNIAEISDALNQQDKLQKTVDNIHAITDKIARGEGSLGRLIDNDGFYLQIVSTMSRIETVMRDISNYGLLFQYDKGWKRARAKRIAQMNSLCTPCDFYHYFNQELCDINVTLGRVSMVLETMRCENMCLDNKGFTDKFRELLEKVGHLEMKLRRATEQLNYCRKCD
ncbi:MAG: MCE family protein [Chlamydiia bacterium]|nr:MCE family protein [Chlamydiia bacterium]